MFPHTRKFRIIHDLDERFAIFIAGTAGTAGRKYFFFPGRFGIRTNIDIATKFTRYIGLVLRGCVRYCFLNII